MDKQVILKSLSALEANLKEINSAKEQVVAVTGSVKGLADVVDKYKESLNSISSSISGILNDSREFNLKTLEEWKCKISEIQVETRKLTESVSGYSIEIKREQKRVVEEFGKGIDSKTVPFEEKLVLLEQYLNSFKIQIYNFQEQVDRISCIDIDAGFKSVQRDLANAESQLDKSLKAIKNDLAISSNRILKSLTTINNEISEMFDSKSRLFNQKINIGGVCIAILVIIDIIIKYLV